MQTINLAVADMLACVHPGYLQLVWTAKTVVSCQILCFINGAFYTGLLWNMVISMERFVIVFFPFRARRYSRKHKIIVAVCVWTIGLGVYVPYIPHVYTIDVLVDGTFCYYNFEIGIEPCLYHWLETIRYGVPALVIATSYLLIGLKLYRRSNIGERDSTQDAQESKKRKQVGLFSYS